MAVTTTNTALALQQWRRNFWREYVRESGFKAFMKADPTAVIHTMMELKTGGETITIPLVDRLKDSGVSGSATLAGNEENLGNYGHNVTVDWRRHAVLLNKKEIHKSAADQMAVVRPLLKEWAMDKLRTDIIDAMQSIDGTNYASQSEANKDTWLANNSDRVLFGVAKSNNSSNDHSASLANIDNTNDQLSTGILTLAKRMAKTADPHIRPFRVGDQGKEYFMMFANSLSFRDLKEDTTMTQANREARPRDVERNPIFQDGDLIYDGVIVREIPEIASITGVGAGGIDVAPNFLCGAQAIAVAYGQMPRPTERKDDDYGFIKGRGIEELIGVSKVQRDEGSSVKRDHGMVTVYTAGVADA